MKKLNDKGFGHHLLILAIAVVVVAAAGYAGMRVLNANKMDAQAASCNTLTIQRGSTNKVCVVGIQTLLNEINQAGLDLDGKFRSQTVNSVERFQKKNAPLVVNGVVDAEQTWPKLCEQAFVSTLAASTANSMGCTVILATPPQRDGYPAPLVFTDTDMGKFAWTPLDDLFQGAHGGTSPLKDTGISFSACRMKVIKRSATEDFDTVYVKATSNGSAGIGTNSTFSLTMFVVGGVVQDGAVTNYLTSKTTSTDLWDSSRRNVLSMVVNVVGINDYAAVTLDDRSSDNVQVLDGSTDLFDPVHVGLCR